LNASAYPVSTFEFRNIETDADVLEFGRLTVADLIGTFTVKGHSMPLKLTVEIEGVVADDGIARLHMSGGFSINLRDFKVEEADGPEPARHTIIYSFNLRYRPKPAA